ncbi:MAG: phenylacetate--CoA ligase family protein [Bryobacteraceae bacterium]
MLLAENRYSEETYKILDELIQHEKLSRAEIEQRQIAKLQYICNVARADTEYYNKYLPIRLTALSQLSQLPILSRDVVRVLAMSMRNRAVPKGDQIWVTTTGTTGASLKVCYSPAVMRRNWAFRMQQFLWAGVPPRSPRITAFGNQIIPSRQKSPPFWMHNIVENQIFVSIFHLSISYAADYVKFLKRHAKWVLEGFPSAVGLLADFVLARGERIPMRAVFTDGEPLSVNLRSRIESAFCTRVFNTYGNTELCGLIQQCEHQKMHVNPDYGFLEIVDDDGVPVKCGDTGYFVWTGFINDSMLLLRYKIGDRGCRLVSQDCPCGRKSAVVDPGVSRESELLYAADGRIFSPRAVNQVLKGATSFRFCQFVQQKSNQVLIRAVGSGARAEQELVEVRRGILSLLGEGTTVEVELASEPIVTRGGKTPLVIREQTLCPGH